MSDRDAELVIWGMVAIAAANSHSWRLFIILVIIRLAVLWWKQRKKA